MKKSVLLILIVLLLFPLVHATNDIFYKGGLQLNLDKEFYSAGNLLSGTLLLSNENDFPISNAYVVLDVQVGCDMPTYPSQFSDCDNIFMERKIIGINLNANSQKEIKFQYKLPENLKSGIYRIDAYFKTNRTPIVGLPFIFAGAKYVAFQVNGTGNFPYVKILRTKTEFKGIEKEVGNWKNTSEYPDWPWSAGPVGVPVVGGENIMGQVFVENQLNSSVSGLTLKVSVCEWDDTSCKILSTKNYEFSLSPKEIKDINISIGAPKDPEAYAIRLQIFKNDELLSLYKSRVIVVGKTARIRKLYINKPYFRKGNHVIINVLAGTSPDHYYYPEVVNSSVQVFVKDLNSNKVVFSESKKINRLSKENVLVPAKFEFTTPVKLSNFELASKIMSDKGKIYDKYSVTIDSKNFASELENITLSANYNPETYLLSLKLCAFDKNGLPVKTNMQAILRNNSSRKILKEEILKAENCAWLNFTTPAGKKYLLTINAKKQFEFQLKVPKINKIQKESGKYNYGFVLLIGTSLAIIILLSVLIWRVKK